MTDLELWDNNYKTHSNITPRTDTYQYSYAYQNFVMATPAGIAPPSILFRYDLAPMEVCRKLN